MTVFHDSAVDRRALRAYRLERVRAQLRAADCPAALLYDPLNIRYATDTSNMQVWTLHNAVRYAFVAVDGPVILFDFHNCDHLSEGIEVVDEVRPAVAYFYFGAGEEGPNRAARWADEIDDLLRAHGGGNRRLAVDKVEPLGLHALEARGIEIVDGQRPLERARAVKNDVELQAIREAIDACQAGMERMYEAMRPGITETALWSHLHQTNIERGGEWIETRLLSSGPRTNPWFRECSNREIEAGDMVSFDTDLIGPNGYCADISRSWIAGGRRPTDEQRALYAVAREQIAHNAALLRPGLEFREFSEKSYRLPEDCVANRYSVVAHGVGLCDEWPGIVYAQDWDHAGYDGRIEAGMTLCVESLVGREGGRECVKLEEQVLVTEDGAVPLSDYPYEDDWL